MDKVLILDFGSQYTQLIARKVRELNFYSIIKPYNIPIDEINNILPSAIILSGGPSSVKDYGAPRLEKEFFNIGVPILGICYGLQLIAFTLGGNVESSTNREYGNANLDILTSDDIFKDIDKKSIKVWMSHGDEVNVIPSDFKLLASTKNVKYAVIKNKKSNIYGVQFHPEVYHSQYGKEILYNFLYHIAGLKQDWKISNLINVLKDKIKSQVDGKVLCGVSGGVDSTVCAVLLKEALGADRVFPIFVNNGLLRKDEQNQVRDLFKKLGINLIYVDRKELFLDKLSGESDPERKRKIIGHTFVDVFMQEAKKVDANFLAQGTLYPDVIESMSASGGGPSTTIKTHHNVGGLSEKLNLNLIEPFRDLFKDEVRALGASLGIPDKFLKRHPFPGPGLAVRIMGDISKVKLDILKEADDIFIKMLEEYSLYDDIWQAFCVLLNDKTVGVMGDSRTYENVLAIRAVTSVDGMTADWFKFPYDFLAKASNRIINEVKGINRVVLDISSKPPATIEWE